MGNLVNSTALKFRWINGQCFEFKMNNGVTLLTDPWFHTDESVDKMLSETCPPGFTLDDIEGADYVFLNHTHLDHIGNLEEVVQKFHSTVITHSGNVLELMKCQEIPVTDMYPVDYEGTYYFDGFVLETHHGTHHRSSRTLSQSLKRNADDRRVFPCAAGGTFNMNFVLTTAQGMRIAFIGGNDDGMIERLQGSNKPNLIIRNKMASSKVKEGVAENFADWFAAVDTQLLVPMHYETWLTKDPEFARNMISDMNRIMAEKGKVGRVAPMVRGKWYTLDLAINEA